MLFVGAPASATRGAGSGQPQTAAPVGRGTQQSGPFDRAGIIGVAAYNFNLYEHRDSFAVQLVGAARYDPVDSSWASEERFSSGEDLFDLPQALVGDDWRGGLATAKSLVSSYLQVGTQAARFRSSRAVAVGFVDGDLELVHILENS